MKRWNGTIEIKRDLKYEAALFEDWKKKNKTKRKTLCYKNGEKTGGRIQMRRVKYAQNVCKLGNRWENDSPIATRQMLREAHTKTRCTE